MKNKIELIDKTALIAEIEKCYNECLKRAKITDSDYWNAKAEAYRNVLVILNNTLEVKEVGTWHLQEKEDIYDAIKDWSLQTFACVMKDGTIQKFIGNLDVDYEGYINIHINGVNDDYDNVDDIVKWIEFT